MAVGNANFDTLLSTTLAHYSKKLVDNVFTARPLTEWLMRKDKIEMLSGGEKIVEQLIYGKNGTVGSYAGYDPIALTPQTGISAAEFQWKQYAASIAISGIEKGKNSGEAAMIKLITARIMQAEESLKEDLSTMLFGDGTGNSSKDFNGLGNLVEANTDIGNIAVADNTWWRSYEDNTSGDVTIAKLNTAYNTISIGNDRPDFLVTTQAQYEVYEGLLQSQVRYTDTATANAGFQNLMFKSGPVVYDTACPTGLFYLLNSKYLKLVGHSDKWFKHTPFVSPEDVDATYALILSYGNMTVCNRKKQGKITGLN